MKKFKPNPSNPNAENKSVLNLKIRNVKLIWTLFISLLVFCFSCAAYQNLNMYNLDIGMSKRSVIQTLGRNPDNLIGAKQYEEGKIEVLQYSRRSHWDSSIVEQYWLYFLDDKLMQWGRPGDWQREADRVYEVRNR